MTSLLSTLSSPDPRVWDKDSIQSLLVRDDAALRALLVIYHRQTDAEQAVGATTDENGVGFTGPDAEILSSFAEFYKRTGFLSAKQLAILHRKIPKYWKQLLEAAKSKGAVVQSHQGPGPVMGGVYQTYKFPDDSSISLHPFGLEVFEGTAEAPRVLSNGKFLRPGWTGRAGVEGLRHAVKS